MEEEVRTIETEIQVRTIEAKVGIEPLIDV
jgi:hypothetical protein